MSSPYYDILPSPASSSLSSSSSSASSRRWWRSSSPSLSSTSASVPSSRSSRSSPWQLSPTTWYNSRVSPERNDSDDEEYSHNRIGSSGRKRRLFHTTAGTTTNQQNGSGSTNSNTNTSTTTTTVIGMKIFMITITVASMMILRYTMTVYDSIATTATTSTSTMTTATNIVHYPATNIVHYPIEEPHPQQRQQQQQQEEDNHHNLNNNNNNNNNNNSNNSTDQNTENYDGNDDNSHYHPSHYQNNQRPTVLPLFLEPYRSIIERSDLVHFNHCNFTTSKPRTNTTNTTMTDATSETLATTISDFHWDHFVNWSQPTIDRFVRQSLLLERRRRGRGRQQQIQPQQPNHTHIHQDDNNHNHNHDHKYIQRRFQWMADVQDEIRLQLLQLYATHHGWCTYEDDNDDIHDENVVVVVDNDDTNNNENSRTGHRKDTSFRFTIKQSTLSSSSSSSSSKSSLEIARDKLQSHMRTLQNGLSSDHHQQQQKRPTHPIWDLVTTATTTNTATTTATNDTVGSSNSSNAIPQQTQQPPPPPHKNAISYPYESQSRIVFVIVAFKDVQHLEALIDAIWLPQHSIIVHLESQTQSTYVDDVSRIVSKYNNDYVGKNDDGNRRGKGNVVMVQFGTIIYETDSVSHINLQIMEWLVHDVQLTFDYISLLDGASFPLWGATELATYLHSSNGHVWLGEITNNNRRVGLSQTGYLVRKRLYTSLFPDMGWTTDDDEKNNERESSAAPASIAAGGGSTVPKKFEMKSKNLFDQSVIPSWMDRVMRYKTNSGNQGVYSYQTVQRLLTTGKVKLLFYLSQHGCCCCVEERSWIAAMALIGRRTEALKRYAMYQLWGGYEPNDDGKCKINMSNEVIVPDPSICYRSENIGSNDNFTFMGDALWDSLVSAKADKGFLFARKFRSNIPASVELRDRIIRELHNSGSGSD